MVEQRLKMGQVVAVLPGGNFDAGGFGKLAMALVVVDRKRFFEPVDIVLGQLPGKLQRCFQVQCAVSVHE